MSADHRTTPHPADRDECSRSPSPCAHSCRNVPGRFSCSCPAGFTLAGDERTCRGEWAPGGEARLGPGPGVLREIPGLGPWPGRTSLRAREPRGSHALFPLRTSYFEGHRGERLKYRGRWGSLKTRTWPPRARGTHTR